MGRLDLAARSCHRARGQDDAAVIVQRVAQDTNGNRQQLADAAVIAGRDQS